MEVYHNHLFTTEPSPHPKYYKTIMQPKAVLAYKQIYINMETQLQDYENREFMIFNVSELDQIDFTQVLETSADTVRRSVDETRTFVKWDGVMPQCVADLTTKEGPYTYEEILAILDTPEWTNAEPMV